MTSTWSGGVSERCWFLGAGYDTLSDPEIAYYASARAFTARYSRHRTNAVTVMVCGR